jgi:transposase
MANTTISMSKIRHILRMYSQGRSIMSIAAQADASRNTVKKYVGSFKASSYTFEEVNALNDKELEDFFGKSKEQPANSRMQSMQRCFPHIDKELKRTGVTRHMLWEAYRKEFPDGYQYSQFCFYYTQWKARVNPVMHMEHKAGDKLYVDFAGEKINFTDKESGEVTEAEVFVAVLGSSQLTYVEAVLSQQKEDFIAACENTLHYIGGVPDAIVPDNLKAAVTKSNRYEPTLNETFADFADHYSTTILPARAYHPRDKALVEGAVKIIYARIYEPLRKTIYHSLSELNTAIREALFAKLKMAKADGSYIKEVAKIERQQLLILDDFGIQPFDSQNRAALMEIIEDRHGKSSLIITSQLPVSKWFEVIGEKTIADAILDRIVHDAHRIELKGESMRKKRKTQEQDKTYE